MKLKLETEGDIVVLCVNEDVSASHVPILKAGLTKLFESGRKTILLDLTAVDAATDPDALQEISMLQSMAPEMDGQMVIASTAPGVGQASSRQEALKLMRTALFGLLSTEARLTAYLRKLERHKLTIEDKIRAGQNSVGGIDVRSLRRDNHELKALVQSLGKQVQQLLESRTEPYVSTVLGEKSETLSKTLIAVLEQEGILPVT